MKLTKKLLVLPLALIAFAIPSKSDISSFEMGVADSDGITAVGIGYSQINGNIMLGASFATDLEEAFDINAIALGAGYVFGDHEAGSFYAEVNYSDSDWSDAEGGLEIGWMKLGRTGTSYHFSVDDDEIVSLGIGLDLGMGRKITFGVSESTGNDLDMDTVVSIGFMSHL